DVGILNPVVRIGRWLIADIHLRLRAGLSARLVFLIPYRDAMPPPQLTADTPVSDVVHPMSVGFGPAFRVKSDPAFLNGFGGRLDARIFHEPLLAQEWLDRHMAPLAVADIMDIIFRFQQQTLFGELLYNCGACFHAVESRKVFARSR